MIEQLTQLRALRCTGCLEEIEVHHAIDCDPQRRVEFVELVTLDHAECDRYKDAHLAKMARRFRKKRLRLPRSSAPARQ